MIAGALARLRDPAAVILESATAKGDLPALEVADSQETFDGGIVQWGTAADRVLEPREDVFVTERDGTVSITSEREKARIEVSTDWVAEVSDSGLLVAESTQGDEDTAFPFGLFGAQTGRLPERLNVDVQELRREWEDRDALHNVTMAGDGDAEATSLTYGAAAGPDSPTTIGIGFEAAWDGDIIEGVVWESGYVRTDLDLEERFAQFVLEEIWPHCYVPEDEEGSEEQQTLDEAADSSDNGEERTPDADVCEYCGGGDYAGLEVVKGYSLCKTCADGVRDPDADMSIEDVRREVSGDGE